MTTTPVHLIKHSKTMRNTKFAFLKNKLKNYNLREYINAAEFK